MVDLISQNQPSSLDAFIINFQSGVRFLTRTLPAGMLNKGAWYDWNVHIVMGSYRNLFAGN